MFFDKDSFWTKFFFDQFFLQKEMLTKFFYKKNCWPIFTQKNVDQIFFTNYLFYQIIFLTKFFCGQNFFLIKSVAKKISKYFLPKVFWKKKIIEQKNL